MVIKENISRLEKDKRFENSLRSFLKELDIIIKMLDEDISEIEDKKIKKEFRVEQEEYMELFKIINLIFVADALTNKVRRRMQKILKHIVPK